MARHREPDGSLRSIWLDLGGPVLMIERTEEPPRRVAGVGAGPFLVAVAISPEECKERERELASGGFPIESRTEHSTYVRDPEGNRVALSSYPIESSSQ